MKKILNRIGILTALFFLAGNPTGVVVNAEEFLAFHAFIEYSSQGYIAKGTFTEIPPDIQLIQPMYSLDGENYTDCGVPWNLGYKDVEDKGALEKLQNQTCLYSNQEPLKSYLDQKIDRFFLKLRLQLENGTIYETQTSLIDRGSPQPVPEEFCTDAFFAPSVAVYDRRPFRSYGRYQITVKEDASYQEIISCLPDTLPIKITFAKGLDHVTDGIINCPVTWKSFVIPKLTAGESLTIEDATEEITIPKDTLVHTPTGIFCLNEPLKLSNQYGLFDEVQLILNVVSKDAAPTGVLTAENDGLELAFHLKPTGATAIDAYVCTENGTAWTSLPAPSLLDTINAQPSAKSSDYTIIITPNQEPYRSYLDETAAGNSPNPFFIGLTIKGGVYDGQNLILAWPDTYEIPPMLPKLGGAGGNELNAGSDNKNDSTPGGQRPNLPENPNKNTSTEKPEEGMTQNPADTPSEESITHTPSQAAPTMKIIPPSKANVSTTTNPANGNTSDSQNQQQETSQAAHNSVPKTQPSSASQPSANTQADTNNHPPTTAADINNSPLTTAADTNNSSLTTADPYTASDSNETAKTSAPQEMPERKAADNNRRIFLLLAAAGIGTAACITAAKRNSIKKLSFLKKLHDKCRTLIRH